MVALLLLSLGALFAAVTPPPPSFLELNRAQGPVEARGSTNGVGGHRRGRLPGNCTCVTPAIARKLGCNASMPMDTNMNFMWVYYLSDITEPTPTSNHSVIPFEIIGMVGPLVCDHRQWPTTSPLALLLALLALTSLDNYAHPRLLQVAIENCTTPTRLGISTLQYSLGLNTTTPGSQVSTREGERERHHHAWPRHPRVNGLAFGLAVVIQGVPFRMHARDNATGATWAIIRNVSTNR